MRVDPAVVGILKEEQEGGKNEGEVAAREVFGILFTRDDGFVETAWGEYLAKIVERLVTEYNGCSFRGVAVAIVDESP